MGDIVNSVMDIFGAGPASKQAAATESAAAQSAAAAKYATDLQREMWQAQQAQQAQLQQAMQAQQHGQRRHRHDPGEDQLDRPRHQRSGQVRPQGGARGSRRPERQRHAPGDVQRRRTGASKNSGYAAHKDLLGRAA